MSSHNRSVRVRSRPRRGILPVNTDVSGRVFTPPATPRTIAYPRSFNTWIEFSVSISSSFNVVSSSVISDALRKSFGLNPSSDVATQSFAFALRRLELYLIPLANDTSYNELVAQVIDVAGPGNAVLKQLAAYGSGQIAARIGFSYPSAIRAFPVQEGANFSWLRVRHGTRVTGDQSVLVRVEVSLRLFGSDVL